MLEQISRWSVQQRLLSDKCVKCMHAFSKTKRILSGFWKETEKRRGRNNPAETLFIQGWSGPDAGAGLFFFRGGRSRCRILTASAYPLCMLTIQLPSSMPTGPPPTILVLLCIKQATDDSSPGKKKTQSRRTQYFIAACAFDCTFHSRRSQESHTVINGDKLFTKSQYKSS